MRPARITRMIWAAMVEAIMSNRPWSPVAIRRTVT